MKQVKGGVIVLLPKVGLGFAVPRNWMPQSKQAFARLVARKDTALPSPSMKELKDLPLIEVPASGPPMNLMCVIVTGDGGWGVTDRGLANTLAAGGIPVVGLNSLQYFWTSRTPEASAADLSRVLRHYLAAWNKEKALVIGYSFGADVLPFMLTRLPKEILGRVQVVALLGPGRTADFEFHLADWLGSYRRETSRPVRPELERLRGMRILCFYGQEDEGALCRDLSPELAIVLPLSGGHHIGGNFQPIAEAILREAQGAAR